MVQESLKCGILVTWTKSFACPDGVGQDAVKMLEDAIARRGVRLSIVTVTKTDTKITKPLLAETYVLLAVIRFLGQFLGVDIMKWVSNVRPPVRQQKGSLISMTFVEVEVDE